MGRGSVSIALRRETLWLILVTAALVGWAGVSASAAPGARVAAGTYKGALRCTGSDRFSNGAPTRHYNSSPRVAVTFAAGQRLERWTYVFLGRRNLVLQSHVVRPGDAFTYLAGKHIGKPGQTRVTIAAVTGRPGAEQLIARLDWASPSTGYFGAGTYALMLERLGPSRIRYEALKVVLKQPRGAATRANPVVRRDELCVGQLSR